MSPFDGRRVQGLIQRHGSVIVRLGFVIDGGLILLALCGVLLALGIDRDARPLIIGILAMQLFQVGAAFSNIYRSWRVVRLRTELTEIAVLWTMTFCVIAVAVLLVSALRREHTGGHHPALVLVAWYLLGLAAIMLFRIGMRMSLRYYRAFGHDHRSAAIVGATQTARDLAETFRTHPWMGIDVIGIYADEVADLPNAEPAASVAGPISELVATARERGIDAIYVTLATAEEDELKGLVDRFGDTTVPIYYCPPLQASDLMSGRWDDVGGHPVISVVESPFKGLDKPLKRLEDLVLAALILPVAIVPMMIIAIGVKLTSPGPVIYRQTRYGLDGRDFRIWKFRTMTVTDSDTAFRQATRNDSRVTPFGAILRRTSLDELPQIFNVIGGTMSVVGPRPHPVKLNEDHRKIIPRYMLRHIVKPGITGWAQVNGYRGETETVDTMRARIEYDLQYIRNWSIWTDMRILLKTVHHVIRRSNAY